MLLERSNHPRLNKRHIRNIGRAIFVEHGRFEDFIEYGQFGTIFRILELIEAGELVQLQCMKDYLTPNQLQFRRLKL
jgi:hypothetical protein